MKYVVGLGSLWMEIDVFHAVLCAAAHGNLRRFAAEAA
jgi:hypothetical protein